MHVHTAFLAGMALDQCARIDNGKLVAIFNNTDLFRRRDNDDGKGCTFGLPAFCAVASVVMGGRGCDLHLDCAFGTLAGKRPAGKLTTTFLQYILDGRM